MISEKIDLTENLDFGRGRLRRFSRINLLDVDSSFWYRLLTTKEFEHIKFRERFFGGVMKSRYFIVFNKTDKEYSEEMKTHCARCGSSIRLPWRNINGICIKCVRIFSKRIPWKIIIQQDSRDILRTR